MSGVVTMQLDELRERFGEAHVDTMASGTMLVTVPGVRLPQGWSKASTAIRFLIPPGYPFAQPDCFWADADLRLASGAIPRARDPTPSPTAGIRACGSRGTLPGRGIRTAIPCRRG